MTDKTPVPPTPEEIAAFEADVARLRGTIAQTAPEVPPAPEPPPPALHNKRITIEEADRPETRADLSHQPGWSHLNTDTDGNPCVWVMSYSCPGCGHIWTDDWSSQVDDDCPMCDVKSVQTDDANWIGPAGEYGRWLALPEAGSKRVKVTETVLVDRNTGAMVASLGFDHDKMPRPEAPVDPRAEAVWLMEQAIQRGLDADLEWEELVAEALRHMAEREADDEANEIVSRSAPRWAWEMIDQELDAASAAATSQNLIGPAMAVWAMQAACENGTDEPITRDEARKMWEQMP